MLQLLAVVAVSCTMAIPFTARTAHAQASDVTALSSAVRSVAGEWNASYNTPGGPRTFKLLLVVEGAKLTGTVKREAGDSPLTGAIKGDTVQFAYAIQYNGNSLDMRITAKVAGDTMKGIVDFAGQQQEAFEATRVPVSKSN